MSTAFSLTPDPAVFFPGETHRASFRALQQGLQEAGGFLILLGEPGTGKTLLKRKLLSEVVDTQSCVAELVPTSLESNDLMTSLLGIFGLANRGLSFKQKQAKFEQFLQQMHAQGRSNLLVIDDAHTVPCAALEMLSQLGNLQADNQPLLQIFLIGRCKLKPALELANRDLFRLHTVALSQLHAMDTQETCDYIKARARTIALELSGEACDDIFQLTSGVPYAINKLCAEIEIKLKLDEINYVDAARVQLALQSLARASRASYGFTPHRQERRANADASVVTEALTKRLEDLENVIGELKQSAREEGSLARSLFADPIDIESENP